MSDGPLALAFELPCLRFALALDLAGLSPDLRALLEARWPRRAPRVETTGTLELDGVPAAVGLPPAELIAAAVTWTGPARAEVLTSGAALTLDLAGGRVRGAGRIDASRARGAVEAAVRAASVIALAQRGVLVLHASAVHRGGDALVFLGASSAGKTTTARRLGREGLWRIADDMIAVDLDAWPPTLHPLPFERAGRPLRGPGPGAAGERPRPLLCRGGALVRKGAPAAGLSPLEDAPRIWAEALITLPPPPGAAPLLLTRFARLCAVPLRALDAPPSGPLAPAVIPWLTALIAEARGAPPAATPPTVPSDPVIAEARGAPPSATGKMLDAPLPDAQAVGPDPPEGTMTEREQARRVARAPNVAWRVLDGAAVLVAPSSPTVQTLNPVGTLVWTLADGRTVPEIVDAVVKDFEVERARASLDVERFVLELEGKGLLVPAADPGSAKTGG